MGTETKIEWCDHTFNPWIGCTKISPGCDHCYAERQMDKRLGKAKWGAGQPRWRTGESNWRLPVLWNWWHSRQMDAWDAGLALAQGDEQDLLLRGFVKPVRPRVFCASLSDVFDSEVDPAWRVDLFELIAKTPNLDWLLLTKRIGNARAMLNETVETMAHGINDWDFLPWPNVWIGATIVNQAEADRDVPKLLAIPAAVRFLSIEPMLGPVDLTKLPTVDPEFPDDGEFYRDVLGQRDWHPDWECGESWLGPAIDWVIAGGESGHNARPVHPDWFRSLRDQCAEAEVPFLFKQWGEWASVSEVSGPGPNFTFPDGQTLRRVGKQLAGRRIDGAMHHAFPPGCLS